jgi:hypothetical protein
VTRDACLQDPVLLAFLVAANLVIFLAYMAIPSTMLWVALRARLLPFPTLWILFGGFITSCGGTHLVAAMVFFRAAWYLEAALCVATAIVSASTAVLLWRWRHLILQAILDYQALAQQMERLRAWNPASS